MSAQIHAATAWPPENNTETPLTGGGGWAPESIWAVSEN